MTKSGADQKYVVEMSWWHKWWDYVNIEFKDQTQILHNFKDSKIHIIDTFDDRLPKGDEDLM